MNKVQFEIAMPAKGKSVGTTSWVLNQLKNVKLSIGNTTSGAFAVFASFDEKEQTAVVVYDARDMYGYYGWNRRDKEYKRLFTYNSDSFSHDTVQYLFAEQLTESAQKIAKKFLDACEEALREYIESDVSAEVEFELVAKQK
jgi:hypothetical protein